MESVNRPWGWTETCLIVDGFERLNRGMEHAVRISGPGIPGDPASIPGGMQVGPGNIRSLFQDQVVSQGDQGAISVA